MCLKVGDDSKMRCKYCSGETSDAEDNNFASKSNHKINCPMESQEPCLSPSVSIQYIDIKRYRPLDTMHFKL